MRDSENSGGLVKYDAARLALSEAVAVDEVKHIHDIAAAMKAYARQANDEQMIVDAAELQIRAKRRLGEMIREQKATVGLNQGSKGQLTGDVPLGGSVAAPPTDDRPTLADAGIDKKLSSQSQAIASIPEEDFEATLAEHRDQQEAVTAKTMEKLGRQGAEQKQKEDTQRKRGTLDGFWQYERIAKQIDAAIDEMEATTPNAPSFIVARDIATRLSRRLRDLAESFAS